MKLIDKLAWIEIQNQKMLSTRSAGKDTWYIPGGKREKGESDEQALIREIEEELSVQLYRESLQLYGVFEEQPHGKSEGVVVRMTCYTGMYSGELRASSEIEEFRRLEYKDKEISSEVDKLIFDDLYQKGYIL